MNNIIKIDKRKSKSFELLCDYALAYMDLYHINNHKGVENIAREIKNIIINFK